MKRSNSRRCSRASCTNAAIKTLTYIYSDSTAVLGPFSPYVEPHNYDLCSIHSERLTVPVGWNVIKEELVNDNSGPSEEDLMAIANAVREVVTSDLGSKTMQPELGRRGHLRVLPSN
ncbi:unannotated protein [freshwater metagenome]|uniref:Unannotated protein n=1 Tax=freshwater metagenome TaxID=449393 RepID=A0A6J7KKK4_9ZZZZ|nr:DUF3499 family protein [Actinomycetota bacterium]